MDGIEISRQSYYMKVQAVKRSMLSYRRVGDT